MAMRKSNWRWILAALMLGAPFMLVAVYYPELPREIPVLHISIGHLTRVASKSPFMVFRVPLMNLTHGLMAAIMLSHVSDFKNPERRMAYANSFSTLLFTIALKSDLEAMDMSAPMFRYSSALEFAALMTVLLGVGLTLVRSRNVPLPWPELTLPIRDKASLAGLFGLYLAVVALSILGSHRA